MSNYSYNGTVLPEVPNYGFAYHLIIEGFPLLVMSNTPFVRKDREWDGLGGAPFILSEINDGGYLIYDKSRNVWSNDRELLQGHKPLSDGGQAYWDARNYLWSNTDIADIDDESMIVYRGTAPVWAGPVYLGWTDGSKDLNYNPLVLPRLPDEGWSLSTHLRVDVPDSDGGDLTYQWYKDGVELTKDEYRDSALAPKTNRMYPAVREIGSHVYHAVVTNTINGVSSSVATSEITVNVIEYDLSIYDPATGDPSGTIPPGVIKPAGSGSGSGSGSGKPIAGVVSDFLQSWLMGYALGLAGKHLPMTNGNVYTPVEYIQFDGTKYVDTGIICTKDTTIEAEFVRDTTVAQYLYGASSSDNTASMTAYMSAGTGSGNWRFGGASVGWSVSSATKHTANVNSSGVTLDGTTKKYSGTVGTFATPVTLVLGTNHTASGSISSTSFYGKVYSYKVYDGENLVMDLVPVVTKDGHYGFMDSVTGRFFPVCSI